MRPRLRQPMPIFRPPGHCFRVLPVEIEHVDARKLTGSDADKRTRAAVPQIPERGHVRFGVLKSMWAGWPFVLVTEEAAEPLCDEIESEFERCHESASGCASRTSAMTASDQRSAVGLSAHAGSAARNASRLLAVMKLRDPIFRASNRPAFMSL